MEPKNEANKEELFCVGYNRHRLKDNDPYNKKEMDFVKAINEEIKWDRNYLNGMVNSKERIYLTPDQEKVVLSVIQWLGTPVGQGFLEKVSKM